VVRLYLDEDVDPLIARPLRGRGYDIVSAREVGMAGFSISDEAQLVYAAAEGRAILTFNTKHFVPLHEAWWEAGRSHAGIIVSRRFDRDEVGELIRLVERLLEKATEDDLANRLRFLGEFDV
jgi:hypothetical protein